MPGVPSGGQGKRPRWAKLLPEMLRPLGYRSYHAGKWHVDGMPLANGFDRSYYVEDVGRYFNPRVALRGRPEAPAGQAGDRLLHDDRHRRPRHQVPEGACREATRPAILPLSRLQLAAFSAAGAAGRHRPVPRSLSGRVGGSPRGAGSGCRSWVSSAAGFSDVEREVGPPYHFPKALKTLGPGEVNRPLPWGTLTEEQRAFQSTKMEIHAAMVDRMDREIGRVLEQIRAMGAFENTLIFFMSDNGASAEIMVRDDGHDRTAPAGSAATHLCLGPGWSTVANTPFRRHKTWVHEGGIATPLVVHWPKGIAARGELRHDPGHLIDIVPTILEVTGRACAVESATAGAVPHATRKEPRAGLCPRRDGASTTTCGGLTRATAPSASGDWKLVAAKNESVGAL